MLYFCILDNLNHKIRNDYTKIQLNYIGDVCFAPVLHTVDDTVTEDHGQPEEECSRRSAFTELRSSEFPVFILAPSTQRIQSDRCPCHPGSSISTPASKSHQCMQRNYTLTLWTTNTLFLINLWICAKAKSQLSSAENSSSWKTNQLLTWSWHSLVIKILKKIPAEVYIFILLSEFFVLLKCWICYCAKQESGSVMDCRR